MSAGRLQGSNQLRRPTVTQHSEGPLRRGPELCPSVFGHGSRQLEAQPGPPSRASVEVGPSYAIATHAPTCLR